MQYFGSMSVVQRRDTASIFKAEVRSVKEVDGLYGVRRRIIPWGLASQSHGMKGDGAVSRPIGKNPFQGTREEGWIRREKEKK
jgi:hypothetical protein